LQPINNSSSTSNTITSTSVQNKVNLSDPNPKINPNNVNNEYFSDNKPISSNIKYDPTDVFSYDPSKIPSISNESAQIRHYYEKLLEKKYEEQREENKGKPLTEVLPGIERAGSRQEDGIVTDDMQYDTDYNHLPMATGYDSTDYEDGYSYLPPKDWYPQPPFPPIWVTEKKCPVCPIFTTGAPADMKEWNDSIRISAPDNINTKYVKKLNAGRWRWI